MVIDALEEAMDTAAREVTRAPQSTRATAASASMIHLLYEILDALGSGVAHQLTPEQRAILAEKFKGVTEHLGRMRMMAEQIEMLGVSVPWHRELAAAMDRLGRTLMDTGLYVPRAPAPPLLETAPGLAAQLRGLLARAEPGQLSADPRSLALVADMLHQQYEFLRGFMPLLVKLGHGHEDWFHELADAVDELRSRRDDVSAKLGRPLPSRVQRGDVLDQYVATAIRGAQPRQLEDGSWFVDLESFPGVWADDRSPDESLSALAEVLEDWLVLKLQLGDTNIPIVDNINLNLPAVSYPILSRR